MDVSVVDDAALMRQFESLGDTCEFGFVQRHFGAEPISLLRWAGAPLAGLLAALQSRFEAIYARENLVLIDGGSVLDRRYDLRFHAGDYAHDGGSGVRPLPATPAAERAYQREYRQIGFRVRLMLESLATGDRIFVYKCNAGLHLADIRKLKAALDSYGPQRLLCVVPASRAAPAGRCRLLASGLKLAGLARFAPYEVQEDFDGPSWLEVCKNALAEEWGTEMATGTQARQPYAAVPDSPGDVAWARELVTACYEVLLGRAPDDGGLEAHVSRLVREHCSVREAMETFLDSAEFRQKLPDFCRRFGG